MPPLPFVRKKMPLPGTTIRRVLIANRGEIAVRIARAAAELGIQSVALYSVDDVCSGHWRRADDAVALSGEGAAAYLNAEAIVDAACKSGCDAVHPGYGFLSEDASFAARCIEAGLCFVGPRPEVLSLLGDKARARALALEVGIPVAKGTATPVSLEQARAFLTSLGSEGKVFIKALAGGGGRGMRMVESLSELDGAYAAARSEAKGAFARDEVYIEELIPHARHIEVQIVGDVGGQITHLYERECTLQRRQQKLVEFAPSPWISDALREQLLQASVALARAAGVHTLCTFEFLVKPDGQFVFMEANPRLQVEHTVTEAVTGIDLVHTQFQLASGRSVAELGLTQAEVPPPRGLAMQLRVNMERIDEQGRLHPAGGVLHAFEPPGGVGVRIDTVARGGWAPSTRFDALLAKLVVHWPTQEPRDLFQRASRALAEFQIEGVDTNIAFLQSLLADADVRSGKVDTRFLERCGAKLGMAMAQQPRRFAPLAQGHDAGSPTASRPEEIPDGVLVVRAPVSGVVMRTVVRAGDVVRSGELVAVVEVMKMEHAVHADASGVIEEVLAATGDAVAAGAPLAWLMPGHVDAHRDSEPVMEEDRSFESHLQAFRGRRAALLDDARQDAVARQHARGTLTARERIARLVDEDSFSEFGALVAPESGSAAPADAILTGTARIDGRPVVVLAQDFTVMGGSNGLLGKTKMVQALKRARINGSPFVMLLDGGGHRIQDGQNSRSFAGGSSTFQELSCLSGWVPIVSAVLGAGFAANTNYSAMANLTIMVRGLSEMGLAGPALVKAGTGEAVNGQALGGSDVQVDRHGLADLAVDTEDEAFEAIRQFLTYFPSNARLPTARRECFDAPDGHALPGLVPANTRQSYDMRKVIHHVADVDSCFEIKPTNGTSMITCLARLKGQAVGFIANQPQARGGMIDAQAAEKAARFIALCDAFGLPLVYLVDVPGMAIGPEAERTVLGRRSARMLYELGHATVPRVSIVLRKGYGLGYLAMCGGRGFEPDACLAWPTAEICAMSIEGSVDVAYRKQFIDAHDPLARRQEIIDGIRSQVSALKAAEGFGIDDVIDPAHTRQRLIDVLSQAPARREPGMPPKFRSIPPI